jgi:hypothetical protein
MGENLESLNHGVYGIVYGIGVDLDALCLAVKSDNLAEVVHCHADRLQDIISSPQILCRVPKQRSFLGRPLRHEEAPIAFQDLKAFPRPIHYDDSPLAARDAASLQQRAHTALQTEEYHTCRQRPIRQSCRNLA